MSVVDRGALIAIARVAAGAAAGTGLCGTVAVDAPRAAGVRAGDSVGYDSAGARGAGTLFVFDSLSDVEAFDRWFRTVSSV